MVVTLLYHGPRIAGLYIGMPNARRFFSENATSVELLLDHLSILCPLGSRFWTDRPELRDPRLCGWLEAKFHHCPSSASIFHLTLVPTGLGVFRLSSQTMPLLPAPGKPLSHSASA